MNITKILAALGVGLTAGVVTADVTVTNKVSQWANNADGSGVLTVTTGTDDFSSYPEGLATPTFWLDAADTSGWTVGADGAVSVIPSKSNTRKLLSDTTGASWTGWGSLANVAPTLVQDATLGANVVDFGAIGSRKAMIFDKKDGEAEEANVLTNIATVVMVVDTSAGGGWVMGGGSSALNEWKRGTWTWNGGQGLTALPTYNPLAAGDAADGLLHGYTRHNGSEFISSSVGWTGGWDVFTFVATSAERAAALAATGLGINDGTATGADASGGMKVAEMIVYDTVLTTAQIESVEKWLRQKWFQTSAWGENGNAYLGSLGTLNKKSSRMGMTTVLKPAAGETLEIGMLHGGRCIGKTSVGDTIPTKQDEVIILGSVKMDDATRYGGSVVLSDATLRFEPRAIPTVDELPSGLVARFDASVASSLTTVTENGTNFITQMTSLAPQKYQGKTLSLRPPSAEYRPWLKDGWTETDLPVVDFGPYLYWKSTPGRNMRFFGDEDVIPKLPLTTVITYYDTRYGGGWVMNDGFRRGTTEGAIHWSYAMLDSTVKLSEDPSLTPANGRVYIDGVRMAEPCVAGTDAAHGCGFGSKILALQVPGATPGMVGGYLNTGCGGLVFGEMLAWDRPLSEDEIRDASAYLAKRWMNKSLPGYERTEDTKIPDLRYVTVSNASEIVIAAGHDARITELILNADLTISGGGVLKVETLKQGSHNIVTRDGSRLVYGDFSDVSKKCEVAAAPGLRFDPTKTNSWTFADCDGTRRVVDFYDYPNSLRLFAGWVTAPWREPKPTYGPRFTTAEFPSGTMPVIDCCKPDGSTGNYALTFERPVAVRSAYVVWNPKTYGTFLLGSVSPSWEDILGYYTGYCYDWHRSNQPEYPSSYGNLFNTNAGQGIRDGECYTNGVKTASTYYVRPASNEWILVEIHSLTPQHVSSLGYDRGGSLKVAYGEVILYERELSEREKTSTRNYLLKKWFGKKESELADLPEDTTVTRAPELVVEEDFTVDGAHDMLIDKLMGGADIYKSGAKNLEIVDCGSYSGTVHVAAGTMTLSGVPTDPGALTLDGAALRLDASQRTTLDTEDVGERCEAPVWRDALGSGVYAKTGKGTYKGSSTTVNLTGTAAYRLDEDLHYKPTIAMAKDANRGECYRFFDADGNWVAFENIYTILWVIGSQEGGGFILGGGDHNSSSPGTQRYYCWHRGGNGGTKASDPLASDSGYSPTRSGDTVYRVNGTQVGAKAENPLSGSWDVMSCQLTTPAPADGLAYDGRTFDGIGYAGRCGNQRLAEIIIYTNKLTDAQIADAENYLAVKWGVNNAVENKTNDAKVELAAGATLDLGGHAQYLGGLYGAGAVVGDVTVANFVADTASAGLTVDGTLTVAANPVVDLQNVTSGDEITIATATSVSATRETLEGATFTGDFGDRKPRLRVKNGRLYVRFNQGLCLLVK